MIIILCLLILCLAACSSPKISESESGESVPSPDNSLDASSGEGSDEAADASHDESKAEISDPKYNGVAQLYITVRGQVEKDAYRECTVRLVDLSGKFAEITDDKAVIKVRGNSTSTGAKKPYNIKFSLSQRPLGLGKGKKFCLLANLYDKSLIRNRLSYDFASELGGCDYTPNTEFVDVYLNNRFLGNYLMTQSVGEGSEKVDINIAANDFLLEFEPYEGYSNPVCISTPQTGILFGFNDPEQPTEAQLSWLYDFFENAENALFSKDIKQIEKYFDIDSFVDFYVVNELFKDVDFATSSTRFYVKNGKLYAGPLWDMDLSSGNVSNAQDFYDEYWNKGGSGDSTESFFCRKIWYKYLFECEAFERLVSKRYAELQPQIINLTTDNELGKNRIDLLIEKYGRSFTANYKKARWRIDIPYGPYETRTPGKTFEENVEQLREWLIKRNSWILSQLSQ